MTIAIISGYFDPLHKGHLDLIRIAKQYREVIVIVNNNEQAIKKKGKFFMDEIERAEIMSNIKGIDDVIISIDKNENVCRTIELIRAMNKKSNIYFINGNEYKKCAETKICKKLNIKLVYEGDKLQSSSNLTGLKKIK